MAISCLERRNKMCEHSVREEYKKLIGAMSMLGSESSRKGRSAEEVADTILDEYWKSGKVLVENDDRVENTLDLLKIIVECIFKIEDGRFEFKDRPFLTTLVSEIGD